MDSFVKKKKVVKDELECIFLLWIWKIDAPGAALCIVFNQFLQNESNGNSEDEI